MTLIFKNKEICRQSGYYPAELDLTITMDTLLNFLFSWIFWLIFESEIGDYLGTISAIFAIVWGFHIRIIHQVIRGIKSCPHCGGIYQAKYLVCSHCGRDMKEITNNISFEVVK